MNKTVFFITAISDPEAIADRLKTVIQDDNDRYELVDGQWFVAFEGISRSLAEQLGIRGEPHLSNGVVIPVMSYSGRADPSLWEWLHKQMNRS
jgi:hypothetical protein